MNKLSKYATEEIFSENSPASNSYVRTLFKRNNLKPYVCEKCKIVNWNGEQLNLQLDHINGIRKDNRMENLRWMCPNCHSLTKTFCSKNVKNKRYPDALVLELCKKHKNVRGVVEELGCNPRLYQRIKRIAKENGVEFPNPYGKIKKVKVKSDYNATHKSRDWIDKIAISNRRVKVRPTREELEKMIDSIPLETVGKNFGLSGNAIKKWCKQFGIQTKPRGYWQKNL